MYELVCAKNNNLEICTYICFVFEEKKNKPINKNLKWIPIRHLNFYNNIYLGPYYKLVYQILLKNLY